MNEALLRADRDRAAFLAGVSHDLRTPIARVRLGLEMDDTDAEGRAAMVKDLEEMNQVIEQFMVFARDESSESESEVELDKLLQSLIARDRSGRVGLVAPDTVLVCGRPKALHRLFANLIDNALKYGGAGAIEVCVRIEHGNAVVEIADRGPGIAGVDVARLKQPFVRRDDARGGPIGSGLGLAIAERIAQLHGSTVELLPRPGGGLTARVVFTALSTGA
jgi:two-component system osmolarity sensor histidine kinase EnvZ